MKFKIYQDKTKAWRWKAKSRNGRIWADSGEGYTRKSDCIKALESFKRAAVYAPIMGAK